MCFRVPFVLYTVCETLSVDSTLNCVSSHIARSDFLLCRRGRSMPSPLRSNQSQPPWLGLGVNPTSRIYLLERNTRASVYVSHDAPPWIVVKCGGWFFVWSCVVVILSCVIWCCSSRVFVCVTCFSSHIHSEPGLMHVVSVNS